MIFYIKRRNEKYMYKNLQTTSDKTANCGGNTELKNPNWVYLSR